MRGRITREPTPINSYVAVIVLTPLFNLLSTRRTAFDEIASSDFHI